MPEGLSVCSFAAALGREEAGAGVPLAAFRGQMAAIYLFDMALSAGRGAMLACHLQKMLCSTAAAFRSSPLARMHSVGTRVPAPV